mmetsp:Transcript_18247/g.28313  ORF Transcript_18247/g.28313 Transcript_18247/m.28313 type:complete len:386 (+) Transcript_18247:561-1718(+)
MPERLAASASSRFVGLKFAQMALADCKEGGQVLCLGPNSLFHALGEFCPSAVRSLEHKGGLSPMELQKLLQRRAQFVRTRQRCKERLVRLAEQLPGYNVDAGKGLYLWAGKRWRDADDPEDRAFLVEKHYELVTEYPHLAQHSSLEHLFTVLRRYRSEWPEVCRRNTEAPACSTDSDPENESQDATGANSPVGTSGSPAGSASVSVAVGVAQANYPALNINLPALASIQEGWIRHTVSSPVSQSRIQSLRTDHSQGIDKKPATWPAWAQQSSSPKIPLNSDAAGSTVSPLAALGSLQSTGAPQPLSPPIPPVQSPLPPKPLTPSQPPEPFSPALIQEVQRNSRTPLDLVAIFTAAEQFKAVIDTVKEVERVTASSILRPEWRDLT